MDLDIGALVVTGPLGGLNDAAPNYWPDPAGGPGYANASNPAAATTRSATAGSTTPGHGLTWTISGWTVSLIGLAQGAGGIAAPWGTRRIGLKDQHLTVSQRFFAPGSQLIACRNPFFPAAPYSGSPRRCSFC